MKTNKQRDKQNKQTSKPTNNQTNEQINKQTNKQNKKNYFYFLLLGTFSFCLAILDNVGLLLGTFG